MRLKTQTYANFINIFVYFCRYFHLVERICATLYKKNYKSHAIPKRIMFMLMTHRIFTFKVKISEFSNKEEKNTNTCEL